MDEIKKELAKAAGTVATDVTEDLVRPTSKSIGENMGLLVDGVMGWLGYWGQKQQIKRAVYLEEYKKQIVQKITKIPEQNLIEPPIRIVGPAIEASKFFIEETTCREMFAELIIMYEESNEIVDIIGSIYMDTKSKDKKLGQVFTPEHIAELMAEINVEKGENFKTIIEKNGFITVMDPACGSGRTCFSLC